MVVVRRPQRSRQRLPLREGGARRDHVGRLGLRNALGRYHRRGGIADIGADQGALRRLQQPRAEGSVAGADRSGDVRSEGEAGAGRPRCGAKRADQPAGQPARAEVAGVARADPGQRREGGSRAQENAVREGVHFRRRAGQGAVHVRRARRSGPHRRRAGESRRGAGGQCRGGHQAARGGARLGAGRSGAHLDRRAGRRHRDLAAGRRRPDGRGEPQHADAVHDCTGPARHAGRGGHRRVGHQQDPLRPARHVHCRRFRRPHVRRPRRADPQGGADGAERRHLHGGRRDRESEPATGAGHDGERPDRGGRARERAEGAERRVALSPAGFGSRQGCGTPRGRGRRRRCTGCAGSGSSTN